MAASLAPLCIYTIKHSKDLVPGQTGFSEGHRWVTAKRILDEARRRDESVAVVFAAAEKTDKLLAWALLDDIHVTPKGTDYTFSKLTRFKKPLRSKTDLRKRDGEPLSQNFIRPYAICRKPKFVG